MPDRVLITGGAGFIGCHLCRTLLASGYQVRVLDDFVEQVHAGEKPNPILRETELIVGNVRNTGLVTKSLRGIDAVIHLAAEVGVGQSMYEIDRYVGANDLGTASLLQALLAHPVRRVVVASSMSIYGEGLYQTANGKLIEDAARNGGDWDPIGADGAPLSPLPTPEWKRPVLASVYAIPKFVQERLVLTVAPAYGMEGVALRLFNVYGPGQALSNPYTGVLAIFAARLLNGKPPQVFEDGRQRRDFVHVSDVALAFLKALEVPEAAGGVFNIGSGRTVTVREIAEQMAAAMNRSDLAPEVLGKARAGDIRHCFADISLARKRLGFEPRQDPAQSMRALAEWVRRQRAVDRALQARRELEIRGLVA
ncbi:MAG: NAD-dependent epimerase/dehydratase family protein [Acetobacteraceae bacterium]|nr:NAD-dependent epimerase/dehydratase family protein [Acetobacteraceae bacterium]